MNPSSNPASKNASKIHLFERRTQKEREAQERRNKAGMKIHECSCSFMCNYSWKIRVRVRSSLEWGTYLSKVYRSSKRTLPTTSGWMSYWARNGIYWENLNAIRWWQWCWWQRYVGDFMMVTDLICWWQNHYVGSIFRYVGDFFNVLNRSPTS